MPRGQRRLDVLEQRVEGGADLADLGALVGEVLGHPLGAASIAPVGQRQLGDRVGGGGDLAQRPQLAAYDDQCRRPPRPATPSSAEQDLPARSGCETVSSTSRGRQPGDDGAAVGVAARDDAVVAEPGERRRSCALAVGGHVGQRRRASSRSSSARVAVVGRRRRWSPAGAGDAVERADPRAVGGRSSPQSPSPGDRAAAVARPWSALRSEAVHLAGRAGRSGSRAAPAWSRSPISSDDHRHQRDGGEHQPRGQGARSGPRLMTPASARSPRRAWCGSSARGRRRSSCAGRRCRARRRWPGRRSRSSRPGRGSAPCDSTRLRVAHQEAQQLELGRGQRDLVAVAAYLVAVLVQLEVADGQHRATRALPGAGPPHQRRAAGRPPPRARTAWSRSRRRRRSARRPGPRRSRGRSGTATGTSGSVGAHPAQHLEAVEVRQHHVEHDGVGAERLRARRPPWLPVWAAATSKPS